MYDALVKTGDVVDAAADVSLFVVTNSNVASKTVFFEVFFEQVLHCGALKTEVIPLRYPALPVSARRELSPPSRFVRFERNGECRFEVMVAAEFGSVDRVTIGLLGETVQKVVCSSVQGCLL